MIDEVDDDITCFIVIEDSGSRTIEDGLVGDSESLITREISIIRCFPIIIRIIIDILIDEAALC